MNNKDIIFFYLYSERETNELVLQMICVCGFYFILIAVGKMLGSRLSFLLPN